MGKLYWPEEALKEAIGCKDDDILGEIKKLREERDVLKEKCDKLKARTNAAYGVSCGYSGDKAPAFRCDVISYSWEFGPITARDLMDKPTYRVSNDSIRVELELTPTANYKGTFDMEDLKRYIQEYGREKKLGVLESVDYQNAKAARAKLAQLYKTVLGKEKLDMDLSPHEIMKAIHDEYKRVRDSQFASDQCLRSVYMHVHEGIGYKTSDIYAAPDKLADGIITRYNSARMTSRLVTLSEIDDHIDELCDKYDVVQPDRKCTTKERLDYIFAVLGRHRTAEDEYRTLANNNFNKAEGFRTEKRALEDSLAELRAKIREIYRSVVDDEWDEHLSYTSAMNDINEEYKRVVHNFEERTADWSKAQQEYSRYRLAVGSLLDIPKETRDDINAIERSFEFSKKQYKSLQEFRDNVREILDIPSSMADDQEQILKEIHDFADRYYELNDFRADICGILGIDTDGLFESPRQNDKYILDQIEKLKDNSTSLDRYARFRSNVCTALCLGGETSDEDILERVRKTREYHDKLFKARHDHEVMIRDLWELRRNAIDDLKSRGFLFRPEENETLPEIYDKLLKRYDWTYGSYKEQYRLRQCWHVRWESENERANGVQKKLDKLRGIEAERDKYKENCGYWHDMYDSVEAARGALTGKIRELKDEKTKVIAALGQDIWDDCLK